MRYATLPVVAVLVLIGCSSREAHQDAMLTAPAVGEAVSCLSADRMTARRPLGPQAMLFETLGGKLYRNELPASCPGLTRNDAMDALVFEMHGSQVCRNDSFRVVDPMAAKTVGWEAFPRCRLGKFIPISKAR